MISSTTSTVTKFAVFSSINAGMVNTMKPTHAVISIFLRPNLSDRCPLAKMNATYVISAMVVISEDSFFGIITAVSRYTGKYVSTT